MTDLDLTSALTALAGGALIGLAAAILLVVRGRIAGISGIIGRLAGGPSALGTDRWQLQFVAGLLIAGVAARLLYPESMAFELDRSWVAIVAAGLLVGVGTRLGSGCTSGHGVCGISRMSPRSLVATMLFVGVGIASATVIRTAFGGSL